MVDITIWTYTRGVAGTQESMMVPKQTFILDDYKRKTNSSYNMLKIELNSLKLKY